GAETGAPPDFAAHRYSYIVRRRSPERGRTCVSAGLQYVSDVFFQSASVCALSTGTAAMCRDEPAPRALRSETAGDPHELSGEPGQLERNVSAEIDAGISRRSGARVGSM